MLFPLLFHASSIVSLRLSPFYQLTHELINELQTLSNVFLFLILSFYLLISILQYSITVSSERLNPTTNVFETRGFFKLCWDVLLHKHIFDLQPLQSDLSEYDAVFIGFPVWGSKPPEDFVQFFNRLNVDWSTKHVFVYDVCGSSGAEGAIKCLVVHSALFHHSCLFRFF